MLRLNGFKVSKKVSESDVSEQDVVVKEITALLKQPENKESFLKNKNKPV